ncbi:TonB family protein [Dankookia sp. GCM10030260]|uniref:TonB family protein n=1 Tax=Dankookia sp. GCM10030260 TaxID=3273390 RepID=UPI003623F116
MRPRSRRLRRGEMRPGLLASLLLHGGFFALIVLAVLTRPPPREPGSTDGYPIEFLTAETAPPAGPEALRSQVPSLPELQEVPPPTAVPPPPAPPLPQPAAPPPSRPAAAPRLAEAAAPPLPVPPPPAPRYAEVPPPPPAQSEALPLPPPPPAPRQERPQQEAAVIAPPRPARPAPPPSEQLPGLWLPDAARLAPSPSQRPQSQARRGMDLSLNSLSVIGRNQPEPQVSIRGATVGDDWRRGFRRWLDENVRYPANAAAVGDEGVNRIQLLVAPDGRVKSWRIVRRSGSVWLDAGLEGPFRNAVLPAFPPGADPDGVEVNLTVHWNIIRP